ncbi:MAG: YidH family protein [Daejeonella sp.]
MLANLFIDLNMQNPSQLPVRTNATDHLANERTYLSWIRTSIGIMGFGFLVVKFSLFIRQVTAALGSEFAVPQTGYSQIIGILLVALGALTIIFAYIRYIKTKQQLDLGIYYHSTLFIKAGTGLIFFISLLLLVYLVVMV